MSELTIYKTNITPDRNAKVDKIQDYLNTCTQSIHSPDFQYQKIALDMTVKVAMPQNRRFDLGNYVDIFQDNKHWYFFIMGSQWISKRGVKLLLSLDTINTFQELTFSDRTQVFREHKDRLISYGDGTNYLRNIWPISEDISIPLYTDGDEDTIIDNTGLPDVDWFLMYKTRDDLTPTNTANPIECDLFASVPLLIKKGREALPSQRYDKPTFMESGKYYYLDWIHNPNADVEVPSGKLGTKESSIFMFYQEDGNIKMRSFQYSKIGSSYTLVSESSSVGTTLKFIQFNQSNKLMVSSDPIKNYTDIVQLTNYLPLATGSQSDVKTVGINQVDKTNSKIMKIIRLPYAPVEVEQNGNGEYVFPADWKYENGYMKLQGNKFNNEFKNVHFSEYEIKELKYSSAFSLSPDQRPQPSLESKLYHSDYYSIKMVYDSFAKEIPLENFDLSRIDTSSTDPSYVPYLVFDFKPTNTINSKFAFRYWMSDPGGYYRLPTLHSTDYNEYLLSSRNNEETIFSNDYVNYIRNGYNYDKKIHSINMWQQGLNMAAQIVSSAASFGWARHIGKANKKMLAHQEYQDTSSAWEKGDVSVQDYAKFLTDADTHILPQYATSGLKSVIPFAQGISTATSTLQSAFNMICSELTFQKQMAAKLANLSAQATSTSGTDDIDLLKYYNKNRLQIIKYKPRWQDKNKLFKFFFYFGYKTDEIKKPNLNSRWWFNYIQCDAHFEEEEQPLYAEFITDIKTRYQQGVTVFHNENGVYNFEQNKENLEAWLVE